MTNTLEERIARLEEQKSMTIKIVQSLLVDFTNVRGLIMENVENLEAARQEEVIAARRKKQAKQEYDEEEASLVFAETNANGKINGKNADARKAQTSALLKHERNEGRLKQYWIELSDAEKDLDMATAEKEILVDRFSALRVVARMIAGLGSALGS